MDAEALALTQQLAAKERLPFITVEKIYYKYRTEADGKITQHLWVNWRKKGQTNGNVTPENWERLARNPNNEIYLALKPYVENFITGETDPIVGTPLAAWPSATPELIEALAAIKIRSCEDFDRMEDHNLQKLSIPGIREKQRHVRAYLQSLGTTAKVTHDLTVLRGDNEALRRELAELRAMVNKQPKPELSDEAPAITAAPPKSKGGRPKGSKNKPATEPQPTAILAEPDYKAA